MPFVIPDGGAPTPVPAPAVASWPPAHTITYKLCNIWTGATIAELPLTGVGFTLGLNSAGPFNSTLDIEDPGVQASDWIAGTLPWQTAIAVDIDGALPFYGPVTGRKTKMSTGTATITGAQNTCYLGQRLQAADYSTNWASNEAGALTMAYTILGNALGIIGDSVPGSLPLVLSVPTSGGSFADPTPAANQIWGTFPLTQAQTLSSILSQLVGLGYGTGIDYVDVSQYIAGVPTGIIQLAYPQAGVTTDSTNLVIDTASDGVIDLEWDEDGTTMSNGIVEMLGSTGGVTTESQWEPSLDAGFPLLEQVISHASFSPADEPTSVLEAFALSDLATFAYPVTSPVVTMNIFNETLPLGSFAIGDTVQLRIPRVTTPGAPGTFPRFPNGLIAYMRIVKCAVKIADEGVSTMDLTLNMPPTDMPVPPPE